MSEHKTLTGTPVPWFEDGGCVMCGFSHRYQYPNQSDASRHDADPIACINSLVPALSEITAERGGWRGAALAMADDDGWIAENVAGMHRDAEGNWSLPQPPQEDTDNDGHISRDTAQRFHSSDPPHAEVIRGLWDLRARNCDRGERDAFDAALSEITAERDEAERNATNFAYRIDELVAALNEARNILGPDHFAGEIEGLVAEGNEALRVLNAALSQPPQEAE